MKIPSLITNSKLYSKSEEEEILKTISNLKEDNYSVCLCKNLLDVKVDALTLICGLNLKRYRNSPEILSEFPKGCEKILENLIKLDAINITEEEISTENIKNLLISIANDIRVIIIKLCEVLAFAQNINELDKTEQQNLHELIKEVYAPISARLGLSVIKSKLQDLNLQFFHGKEYAKIDAQLSILKNEREKEIQKNVLKLKILLKKLNISGEVYGRVKHISSIFNKLKDKNLTLNTIYDLLAVRVIVNTVSECYEVLAEVNSLYQPIDGRFKDYIARPKPNGYKSIHTTVISSNNDPLEIQIRTKEMHEFAEYGVAAHFLYKEKKNKISKSDEKLIWVKKILENSDVSSTSEILDELKTDLYANEIFVQTPLGKVISLKENSTPIDFAYAIHSDVGNKCVGAKVNSKIVPLNTHLKNGDVVEIITNANSHGPSRDWLKIVNTTQARNRMNAFFKKEMKEENIKKGKAMLEATAKAKKIDLKNLLVDEWLEELFNKWSMKNLDDLYASVGYGGLTSTQVVNRLFNKYNEKLKATSVIQQTKTKKPENAVQFKGIDNLMVRYAKCCGPVPGDEIIGFISLGKGVTIHCTNCKNLKNLNSDRLIEASWTPNIDKKFNCSFIVCCLKSENSVLNITKKISELKIELTGLKVNLKDNSTQIIEIEVNVKDSQELTNLINKLKQDKNIINVERTKGE